MEEQILKVRTGGSCWLSRMWLQGNGGCLIWLCDVSRWSDNTIQGLWWTAALAAATNEQFAYVWPLASERHSINHMSTAAAVGVSVLQLSFASSLSTPTPSLHFLSASSQQFFLCSPYIPLFFFPHYLTPSVFSVSLSTFHIIAQTGFSKTAKCFYMKTSFASHSWCGGGTASTRETGETGVWESQLWG